ncbi:DUF3488 domain-containing protein [Streptomyces sp. MS1.HAVA.3]|uniref:DUF3488 domain-containing protein n=1 Tax=Streptomyces caledonius TaxID=3134107 RepID=A0ABU8U9Z5_9ACTN
MVAEPPGGVDGLAAPRCGAADRAECGRGGLPAGAAGPVADRGRAAAGVVAAARVPLRRQGRVRRDGPLAYLVTDFGALFGQGVKDVGEFAIPAPLTDGIRLLLVSGVLLIGLLVDTLAVTARTAAAAGLPLLALYSVAAGLSGGGEASWVSFLLAGCGYLMMLLAEGRDRLAQWGRVFGAAPRGRGAADSGLSSGGGQATAPVRFGRRIGAITLGLALAVPMALPALGGGLLGGKQDDAESGAAGGTISAVNPLVSLQSNLNAQDNRVVLKYRTDNPQQSEQYLRIVALDEFNGVKWEASGRALVDVPKRMPEPPGLGARSAAAPRRCAPTSRRRTPSPSATSPCRIRRRRWRSAGSGGSSPSAGRWSATSWAGTGSRTSRARRTPCGACC